MGGLYRCKKNLYLDHKFDLFSERICLTHASKWATKILNFSSLFSLSCGLFSNQRENYKTTEPLLFLNKIMKYSVENFTKISERMNTNIYKGANNTVLAAFIAYRQSI